MENKFMRYAIDEAKKAAKNGDVPVGAVLVKNGEIIARAHNTREKENSILGHAEISVILDAGKKFNNWRLDGTQLYVTLEPCLMCFGAIKAARIDSLYFGAYDRQEGALSAYKEIDKNTSLKCYCGIMEDECSKLLTGFFVEQRKRNTYKS